jgi:hypothetical protein
MNTKEMQEARAINNICSTIKKQQQEINKILTLYKGIKPEDKPEVYDANASYEQYMSPPAKARIMADILAGATLDVDNAPEGYEDFFPLVEKSLDNDIYYPPVDSDILTIEHDTTMNDAEFIKLQHSLTDELMERIAIAMINSDKSDLIKQKLAYLTANAIMNMSMDDIETIKNGSYSPVTIKFDLEG